MRRFLHKYIGITLALTFILTIIMGCSGSLKGSKIMSQDDIKDRDIIAIEVTFVHKDNPLKSPVASLKRGVQDQNVYIDEFKNIINTAKGAPLKDGDRYCPITDSSHKINVDFGDDITLEFFYCKANNWIIWSHFEEIEGESVLKYYFLSPKDPLGEWLKSIEPLATPKD